MTLKRAVSTFLLFFGLLTAVLAAPASDKVKGPVSDDFLTDTVRSRLAADAIVKGGAIDVDIHSGDVVLKGTVEEEKQRVRAEKIVKAVKGVKSVRNEIKLAHP